MEMSDFRLPDWSTYGARGDTRWPRCEYVAQYSLYDMAVAYEDDPGLFTTCDGYGCEFCIGEPPAPYDFVECSLCEGRYLSESCKRDERGVVCEYCAQC